jgi:hypothetical protein
MRTVHPASDPRRLEPFMSMPNFHPLTRHARGLLAVPVALAVAPADFAQAGTPLPDPAAFTLKVAPGISATSKASGEPLYLVKTEGRWRVSDKPENLTQPHVERLLVDPSTATVTLDATLPKASVRESQRGVGADNRFECFSGLMGTGERKADSYNVCASSFIKSDTGAGEAIIGGLNLLVGSVRKMVRVDVDALNAALVESDAAARVAELRRQANERWLADYRARFESAKTVSDLQRFLNLASIADPDDLVPAAQERLAAARQVEEAQRQRYAAEREVRRAQEDAKRAQEEEARLAWARQLKVGDDTFCGPVIEVRPPMIRIAVRAQLAGFSSEQWLRDTEVHRPERGCLNQNGNLRPLRQP